MLEALFYVDNSNLKKLTVYFSDCKSKANFIILITQKLLTQISVNRISKLTIFPEQIYGPSIKCLFHDIQLVVQSITFMKINFKSIFLSL